MKGRIKALLRLGVVLLRFIVHPVDFLRLYDREAAIAQTAHDYTLQRAQNDLRDAVTHLEAEIAALRADRA